MEYEQQPRTGGARTRGGYRPPTQLPSPRPRGGARRTSGQEQLQGQSLGESEDQGGGVQGDQQQPHQGLCVSGAGGGDGRKAAARQLPPGLPRWGSGGAGGTAGAGTKAGEDRGAGEPGFEYGYVVGDGEAPEAGGGAGGSNLLAGAVVQGPARGAGGASGVSGVSGGAGGRTLESGGSARSRSARGRGRAAGSGGGRASGRGPDSGVAAPLTPLPAPAAAHSHHPHGGLSHAGPQGVRVLGADGSLGHTPSHAQDLGGPMGEVDGVPPQPPPPPAGKSKGKGRKQSARKAAPAPATTSSQPRVSEARTPPPVPPPPPLPADGAAAGPEPSPGPMGPLAGSARRRRAGVVRGGGSMPPAPPPPPPRGGGGGGGGGVTRELVAAVQSALLEVGAVEGAGGVPVHEGVVVLLCVGWVSFN